MRKVVLAGTVAVLTTCTFAATEVTWVGAVDTDINKPQNWDPQVEKSRDTPF